MVRLFMIRELETLHLIDPSLSENEKWDTSKIYYPHSTSHFLGLDVHDVGARDLTFETGMVLTIEPGIYIASE
jgi:Xaa-Pro aminopeptidase